MQYGLDYLSFCPTVASSTFLFDESRQDLNRIEIRQVPSLVQHCYSIVFLDESHFKVLGQCVQCVRRSIGEQVRAAHIQQHVKHPDKILFWGSFMASGPGSWFPVAGMINSNGYIDVLQSKVLPHLRREFPDNNGILRQDLALCHTSKKVKQFMNDNGITVLD